MTYEVILHLMEELCLHEVIIHLIKSVKKDVTFKKKKKKFLLVIFEVKLHTMKNLTIYDVNYLK